MRGNWLVQLVKHLLLVLALAVMSVLWDWAPCRALFSAWNLSGFPSPSPSAPLHCTFSLSLSQINTYFKKCLMIPMPHSRHEINIHLLTEGCRRGKERKDSLRFICIVGKQKGLYFCLWRCKWPVSFSLQICSGSYSLFWLKHPFHPFKKYFLNTFHPPGTVLGIWCPLFSCICSRVCGHRQEIL